MTDNASEFPGYTALAEPELLFHNGSTGKHPLTGLIEHGPYGQRFGAPSTLRLALLAPRSDMPRLTKLVDELNVRPSRARRKTTIPSTPGSVRCSESPSLPGMPGSSGHSPTHSTAMPLPRTRSHSRGVCSKPSTS